MDYKYFRDIYIRYLRNFLAKDEMTATTFDKFMALAYAVRSELVPYWITTQRNYIGKRRLYLLSMEHMLGKSLQRNMTNLGIEDAFTAVVSSLGISMKDLFDKDDELDFGNSGKARLVACLLESMTTLGIPVMAYGMRYDYGQFRQEIKNGRQMEYPNDWLHKGHPWEIVRSEYACLVKFFGESQCVDNSVPLGPFEWKNAEEVYAMPYDTPIVGHKNEAVNTLRLWSAWANEEFLPDYLHHNDYVRACEEKSFSGRITKVLFPSEDVRRAHDMRIKQQYFFASASIQDIVRRHKQNGNSIDTLDEKVAVHLNGSSCALAVPEMMRVLVDQELVEWKRAWKMTQNIFSYSTSAICRDHLEAWPVYKISQMFPRIMQIIFDINLEHLDELRERAGNDVNVLRDLSLIEEGEVKRIRFSNMAILGSRSASSVSSAHHEFMRANVFAAYNKHYPEKFNCKVNGVSHRHWLYNSNRPLAALITRLIGDKWINNSAELEKLAPHATSEKVLKEFRNIKDMAKAQLAETLKNKLGVTVDPTMMFDMHTRTIHPSKRQVMHLYYIFAKYLDFKKRGVVPKVRRCIIFAGKASPADFLAKQIIQYSNIIADLINNDEEARKYMQIVFVPDFGVSWAEQIVPAAELCEQLSNPINEAGGTFAMKYAFNGALPVLSRAGTNLELIERLGEDNVFAFGRTAKELSELHDYNPRHIIESTEKYREIGEFMGEHVKSVPDGHMIYPYLTSLADSDRNFVVIDTEDFAKKQDKAEELYLDKSAWDKKAFANLSKMGWFSTDRLAKELAAGVWKL